MQETVTLQHENGFPAAIAPKGDVPNLVDVAATRIGKHSFGITREGSAAALRLLADQIDANMVIPQSMIDANGTSVDDFTIRTLTFTFAARHAGDCPS